MSAAAADPQRPQPADDHEDQDASGAKIGLGVALVALAALTGLVVFSVVASTVVVWFFSNSQAPCGPATQSDSSTGADNSVPLQP